MPKPSTLLQPDEGGEISADDTQWMYAVSIPNTNDFLIDSGAATSVCQQSLADSLGGKPRGHQFTTTGNTTICLRTREGVNVSSDFQIAPKDTGLQRSIVSVGQVCDRGNIITFRSTGGTILQRIHWQSN